MKKIDKKTRVLIIKNKIKKFLQSSKQEVIETQEMFKIFLNKNSTEEDIEKRFLQLRDLGKMSLLAPILVLPGSGITIPLLFKLSSKYNIDITPTAFKYHFHDIGIERNNKNIKISKVLVKFNMQITKENFDLYLKIEKKGLKFNVQNILKELNQIDENKYVLNI